jgi:IclR family transcriptional regulator, pca regulon regulatory protein
MPMNEPSDREIMGGFAKGLGVIEAFGPDRDELTISDVARLTALDRATARRCLLTLVKLGYATSNGKQFRLTSRMLRLGYSYLSATPLPRIAQPVLDQLSKRTGESCSLSVLDGDEIVYLARSSQMRVLSIGLGVGSRLPAYCASMGRVLLAAMPEADARSLLDRGGRRKLTAKTLTDLDDLLAELQTIRLQGHCIVDEELEIGLRSIAVPLQNRRGETIGAINFGAQAARAPLSRLRGELLEALRAGKKQIEGSLT